MLKFFSHSQYWVENTEKKNQMTIIRVSITKKGWKMLKHDGCTEFTVLKKNYFSHDSCTKNLWVIREKRKKIKLNFH